MDNETKEKAAELAGEAKKKASGIWAKIVALWKSGTKGKVICIVGALAILGIVGAFTGNGEDGGGGGGDGGRGLKISDKDFYSAVNGAAPEDEGTVYAFDGKGLKVVQSTSNGCLVESTGNGDRWVWVETKKHYIDGAKLAEGYYIRRGITEYESFLGKRTVARYVEVNGSLLEKVKKQIADEKAAAEARAKAEAEAKAKAKAEHETAMAKAKTEIAAMQVGKKAGETKTITLPGGVQMEMVWCPSGTFMMGSNDGDSDEKPVHKVTLTKGFWLAKTEVTQAQWKSVMGNNPSHHKGEDLPVEEVSWYACKRFCENTGLQLPTEAQWEYACRAGSTGPYAGRGNLDEMGWHGGNSGRETHPVGQKQPNAWGLFDMHGNVREWCSDYDGNYPDDAVTDPEETWGGFDHVVRGGSWRGSEVGCSSTIRGFVNRELHDDALGFRPARVLSE